MSELQYRKALRADVPAMAQVRIADWGTEEYWRTRMLDYLTAASNPGQALQPRIAYVCLDNDVVVGLIAGHLTRRYGCDGELQWISVRPQYRGSGVAAELLRRLSAWFVRHKALKVCVDVEPANKIARRFYGRHGAKDLKPHWMIWKDIRLAGKATSSNPEA